MILLPGAPSLDRSLIQGWESMNHYSPFLPARESDSTLSQRTQGTRRTGHPAVSPLGLMVLLCDRFDFLDFRRELRREVVYGLRIITLLIGFREQGDDLILSVTNQGPEEISFLKCDLCADAWAEFLIDR